MKVGRISRRKFFRIGVGGASLSALLSCNIFQKPNRTSELSAKEIDVLETIRALLTQTSYSEGGRNFFAGRAREDARYRERYEIVIGTLNAWLIQKFSEGAYEIDRDVLEARAKTFLQVMRSHESSPSHSEEEAEAVDSFFGECFLHFSRNEAWRIIGYEAPPGFPLPLSAYSKSPLVEASDS